MMSVPTASDIWNALALGTRAVVFLNALHFVRWTLTLINQRCTSHDYPDGLATPGYTRRYPTCNPYRGSNAQTRFFSRISKKAGYSFKSRRDEILVATVPIAYRDRGIKCNDECADYVSYLKCASSRHTCSRFFSTHCISCDEPHLNQPKVYVAQLSSV